MTFVCYIMNESQSQQFWWLHLLTNKTRETGQKDLGEEFFTTYQIPKRNVNIELSVNLLLVAS